MAMGGGGSGEGGLSIRRRELPPGFGVAGEDRSLGAGCIWLVHGLYPGSGMGWGGGGDLDFLPGKGSSQVNSGNLVRLTLESFCEREFLSFPGNLLI